MRLFKSDWVNWILQTMKVPDDVPIEHKRVTNAIASAQQQVETQNFESRKNILKYDDVMNRQRSVIYAERRKVLEGEDLEAWVSTMIGDVIAGYVNGATTQSYASDWDLDSLWEAFAKLFPVSVTIEDLENEHGGRSNLTRENIIAAISEDAREAYGRREKELTPELTRELERRVVLNVLDRKWRDHLYEMDYLREGIGLRAYSQRDPLIEYQAEGYDMFNRMMESIAEETVGYLFNVKVQVTVKGKAPAAGAAATNGAAEATEDAAPEIDAPGLDERDEPQNLTYSAPTETGETEVRKEGDKDADEANKARAAQKAKQRQRQKAKAQRQSRKRNR